MIARALLFSLSASNPLPSHDRVDQCCFSYLFSILFYLTTTTMGMRSISLSRYTKRMARLVVITKSKYTPNRFFASLHLCYRYIFYRTYLKIVLAVK